MRWGLQGCCRHICSAPATCEKPRNGRFRRAVYLAVRVGPLNGQAIVVEHPSEDLNRLNTLMRSLDPGAHRFRPGGDRRRGACGQGSGSVVLGPALETRPIRSLCGSAASRSLQSAKPCSCPATHARSGTAPMRRHHHAGWDGPQLLPASRSSPGASSPPRRGSRQAPACSSGPLCCCSSSSWWASVSRCGAEERS
jgi:hypothetical protein